jgi:ammonia channel protein AmtB
MFATFVLAFAALAPVLLRGAKASRVLDEMMAIRATRDVTLAFAFALATFVFAPFATLIGSGGQRHGGCLGENGLSRLRHDERADTNPQFRTHMLLSRFRRWA